MVEFDFYVNEYTGTVIPDEKAFKQSLVDANTYLSTVIHGDARNSDQEKLVHLCLCKIADLIYQDTVNRLEHGGRDVKSETTDGYRVDYATEAEAGKIAVNALDTKIYGVVRRYLSPTGLLYSGVKSRACERGNYYI